MKPYNFVAFGFVACLSLLLTGLWSDLTRAWKISELEYPAARQMLAFNGFPLEPLREKLNGFLSTDKALSLGAPFAVSDFFRQRAAEVFYPRLLDTNSPIRLELRTEKDPPVENSTVLFVSPQNERVTLLGIKSEAPSEAGSPEALFSSSGFALGLLSVLGFMLSFVFLSLGFFEGVLAGALALAWTQQLGTWFQFPVAKPMAYAGLALLPVSLIGIFVKKIKPRFVRPTGAEAFFAATLVLFVFLGFWLPVTLWDGRSIWLFHAKQIVLHGFSPLATLLSPQLDFSHPEYFAFWSAWLAQFSVLGERYSERAVATGGMLLSSTVWMILWITSRRTIGKLQGALFTGTVILATETLALGAYADGLLVALLAIAFLELTGETKTKLGWIALACAASLKFEGFVFSALLFCLLALKDRSVAKRTWIFAPSVAHIAWGKIIGLKGDFHDVDLAGSLGNFFERLAVIFQAFAGSLLQLGYVKCHGLIWSGLTALCIFTGIRIFSKRREKQSDRAFALAGACTLVVFALFLITPKDPAWHVGTAGDRLLLTPSMLCLLGLLRLL